MQLHEANARLKKEITVEELDNIHMLYCILDFMDKDDFCKMVDAVGIEKLVEGKGTYDRLFEAEKLLNAKRNHEKKKNEVAELDLHIKELTRQRKAALEEITEYEQEQEKNQIECTAILKPYHNPPYHPNIRVGG